MGDLERIDAWAEVAVLQRELQDATRRAHLADLRALLDERLPGAVDDLLAVAIAEVKAIRDEEPSAAAA